MIKYQIFYYMFSFSQFLQALQQGQKCSLQPPTAWAFVGRNRIMMVAAKSLDTGLKRRSVTQFSGWEKTRFPALNATTRWKALLRVLNTSSECMQWIALASAKQAKHQRELWHKIQLVSTSQSKSNSWQSRSAKAILTCYLMMQIYRFSGKTRSYKCIKINSLNQMVCAPKWWWKPNHRLHCWAQAIYSHRRRSLA